MNSTAIVLILISCTSHAAWNLLSKRSSRTSAFFWIANAAVVVAVAPLFVWLGGLELVRKAPAPLWTCVAVTGLAQGAYFASLARAYRHGDISIVYPMARTFPIFVVIIAGMLFGQWPTLAAYIGIFLVVLGCFILPMRRFTLGPDGFAVGNYLNRASIWALLTALASSGYTIADDRAMRMMQALTLTESPLGGLGRLAPLRPAILYGYLEWVWTSVVLLFVALQWGGAAEIKRAWRQERKTALLVGALVFGTYLLILWAYTESEKVAYVAGFRQLSIVLGVIGGVLFFKERGGRVRVVASVVIVGGLILIALAR